MRVILNLLVTSVLVILPLARGFAQDDVPVYRHREVDDRMGGSTKAKSAMQRYKDNPSPSVQEPSRQKPAPEKKIAEPALPPEKKPDLPAPQDSDTKLSVDQNESDQGPAQSAETGSPAEAPLQEDHIVSRSDKPARVPSVLKVNYTALESLGTLNSSASGSLGIDLWDGSARSQILKLVNQLPPPRYYGVLQRMNQRALLTSADATLMGSRGNVQAGEDFQTVRIEKLLDTGSYLQASQLYMADPAIAYHERLARAGVQSLFLSHQPAVACLETKTMMTRFESQPFWNQASVICDYILGKMAGQDMRHFADRPDVKLVAKESRILSYVFDKPGYKVTPKNFDDLKDYTPLETALLLNDNRIALNKLDIRNIKEAPSHTIGALMNVADAPGDIKLRLWDEALRRGMITPAELGNIYADTKVGQNNKTPQQADGWLTLPAYYQAMTAARDKDQKKKLGQEALRLATQYPAATLTPFAEYASTFSADGLDSSSIRRISYVAVLAGIPVSRSLERELWNQAAGSDESSEVALWLAIANAALQNFSTEEMPKYDVFQQLTLKLPETSKSLVFALIEKLDNSNKLHNSVTDLVYEKQDGLTAPRDYDYVMPSSDLMGTFSSAHKDKRLGEVILLSAIALSDIPPSRLDPAALAEVIEGLKTVGLTSEARELASEVILGLGTEK